MRRLRMQDAGGTRHGSRREGRSGAGNPLGWAGRPVLLAVALLVGLTACDTGPDLDTRTFEVQYLAQYEIDQLLMPYVFQDREDSPGTMSTMEGAVTVRETPDNLEKIARVLEEYDRPKPTVVLHFQIIEADGAGEPDPAIADVERELRRLFRFDGYRLEAETQVTAIQGSGVRQFVGYEEDRGFVIEGGVNEVRRGDTGTTVTLDVRLGVARVGDVLETSVAIPAGHSVVLGTASAPTYEGALILVVRAEIVESSPPTTETGG